MTNLESPGSAVASDVDCVNYISGLIRILVMDTDREAFDRLENALWMWPHRISLARSIDHAQRLCRHLTPTAILLAVDRRAIGETTSVAELHARLPEVPIVALVSEEQYSRRARFLEVGADAVLMREDAGQSNLHELLVNVQRKVGGKGVPRGTASPALRRSWKGSAMFGALICDISGAIIDCNSCLATWLDYPASSELVDKTVPGDLAVSTSAWDSWKQVAGDTGALIDTELSVASRTGQRLSVRAEVSTVPGHPSYLQVVFIDQTELAMLRARQDS